MKISGSLSVVSISSNGIGQATARHLSSKGSHVLMLGSDAAILHDLETEISEAVGRAASYQVDLTDASAIGSVASRIIAEYGSPDVLINCAAHKRWLPLLETSAEEAAGLMALPYLAAFNLTRELLPCMLEKGSGQIVNVTSASRRLAWPGAVAYTAACAAMEGFTNGLRADVRGSGISVMLATFGTAHPAYRRAATGSPDQLPTPRFTNTHLSLSQAAISIVLGIERGKREIIRPGIFRALFALNSVVPSTVARFLARQ